MPSLAQSRERFRLDERNHIERPLLDQLAGLGWEVVDLTDITQTPADTHPEEFHRRRDAAGAARAAQGRQLARRRSGRGKVRNGYADGSHSEIEVSHCEDWGPDEIRERGIRLIRFMERRWDIRFGDDQVREKLLCIGSVDGEEPDGEDSE